MQEHVVQLGGDPERLLRILTSALTENGFWRFKHMDYFVRSRQGMRDVVGWRRGDEQSGRYAVYFGVWVPELEPDFCGQEVDDTRHIRNMDLMQDLSPACTTPLPLWWVEEEINAAHQEKFLRQQIQNMALPYFDSFASIGDVAEMIFFDPRYHNTALEQRLLDNPFSSLFHYEVEHACEQVVTALKPLQKLTPAFQYAQGCFWRKRGEVFDIIMPRYLASWRFVQIQTMVWHPMLDGMESTPDTLPTGFAHVAWRSFLENGHSKAYQPPAFLGDTTLAHVTLESQIEGIRSHGLAWLEGIQTLEDVRSAIRPEFKKFYPS